MNCPNCGTAMEEVSKWQMALLEAGYVPVAD